MAASGFGHAAAGSLLAVHIHIYICTLQLIQAVALQVFVGGMPRAATEEQLTEFASAAGEVCTLEHTERPRQKNILCVVT